MPGVPEEVSFFARSAAFALVIATIYWFVSYEPAGTTLLAFFGVASSLAAIVLFRAWRRSVGSVTPGAERPFADESGRIRATPSRRSKSASGSRWPPSASSSGHG